MLNSLSFSFASVCMCLYTKMVPLYGSSPIQNVSNGARINKHSRNWESFPLLIRLLQFLWAGWIFHELAENVFRCDTSYPSKSGFGENHTVDPLGVINPMSTRMLGTVWHGIFWVSRCSRVSRKVGEEVSKVITRLVVYNWKTDSRGANSLLTRLCWKGVALNEGNGQNILE